MHEVRAIRVKVHVDRFLSSILLRLMDTTLVTRRKDVIRHLVGSPITIRRIRRILSVRSRLRNVTLTPCVRRRVLVRLRVRLVVPKRSNSSTFNVLTFATFRMAILVGMDPRVVTLLLNKVDRLAHLTIDVVNGIPLVRHLTKYQGMRRII